MSAFPPPDLSNATSDIYRAILLRDPDLAGMAHYTARLREHGLRRVLEEFLACDEYRALSRTGPNPDLNWGAKMKIQFDLSNAQIDRLWDHVSQVWTGLGTSDPFWSVLTNERYRRPKMSDVAIMEEFYASGIGDVDYLRAFLNRADLTLTPDMVVAEYGCGLGRVTRFLARASARVLAFDISATHLEAARHRLEKDGITNVEFVHVDGQTSLARLTNVDLFFSIIVLQHNPPPVILGILDAAFAGLRPGGLAFFQVPTYSSGYSFEFEGFLEKEGRAKSMEMHFVPQANILRVAQARGMQVLEIKQDHLVGNYQRWVSNTFLMQKEVHTMLSVNPSLPMGAGTSVESLVANVAGYVEESIADKVKKYPWFHSIDLGHGIVTPGGKSSAIHAAESAAFFDPIKMDGATIIDIGAWNGFYSFEAKRRGASRVLATDHFTWNHEMFRGRETFDLARSALGLDVEALDIDVPELSPEKVGTFDVVLFLGVFYHLFDPIDGLRRAASLTKEVLVVETHTDLGEIDRPAMVMYPGAECAGDPTNWWGPNNACVRALLNTMGFVRIDGPETFSPRAIFHAWKSTRLART
jgi:tRNA (mo5U34)-methyltransferase